ncbi:MAG TPA: outer membrane beta-barrel protein [Vitreimonas sp.]|uniref:OmpA family protein n=1 Tax=Vitreimonas sp. TaxID=3069702 RepID=UPI002D5B6814|nr:outer membrane beta-barrel protein [Vitreimonas sp.]HYD89240.1 outer membrane beta-barrel protein [Vitreimonas sp.]
MKSKLMRTLAIAILMASAATVANAQEGWYGRLDVGTSIDGEIDDSVTSYDLEDDFVASVGAGYGFAGGFRAEGAIDYRNNDIDTLADEVKVWSAMANVYYDFNRGGRFQPYLGLGVGYVNAETDAFDDADGWAYQGMAGVGYAMSENAVLDIGYRYFMAPEIDFDTFDADYEQQAVMVGIRWGFGAQEAPPPPVTTTPPPPVTTPPPPQIVACPTSDFVVYFEWDRSNLNQAALETIDAAVNRARQCNVSNVVVVGHTDTSGSPQYNEGLSERRASVVRDALVARGIDAGSITTQARGETDLARPTADGVREPLNRRTAVTISFG